MNKHQFIILGSISSYHNQILFPIKSSSILLEFGVEDSWPGWFFRRVPFGNGSCSCDCFVVDRKRELQCVEEQKEKWRHSIACASLTAKETEAIGAAV